MRCKIPTFEIEYDREKHRVNTTTERIFGLLNEMSVKDTHLEEGRDTFKRLYEYMLDIMLPERAKMLIEESIDLYLTVRKEQWGMTQYDTAFYLQNIEG